MAPPTYFVTFDFSETGTCPYWATSLDCCTDSNKCKVNQGDCDSDSNCEEGLKCGTSNCPAEYPNSYDCCYLPGRYKLFHVLP